MATKHTNTDIIVHICNLITKRMGAGTSFETIRFFTAICDGYESSKQLKEYFGFTPAAISRQTRKLEAMGLIRRIEVTGETGYFYQPTGRGWDISADIQRIMYEGAECHNESGLQIKYSKGGE